jgi:hypothetical protein
MSGPKEKPPQRGGGSAETNKSGSSTTTSKSTGLLRSQSHPGFTDLKSKPGVYRCRLYPQYRKQDTRHADFKGELLLANCKCSILVWIHRDSTLGLRLEKIQQRGAKQ